MIPLVNYEDSQKEQQILGNGDLTPAEVESLVRDTADLFDSLFAEIDGIPVPNLFSHREASPQFSWTGAVDNPFGWGAIDSGAAYADGYWLMLEPLGKRTTTIEFGGGSSQLGFAVRVSDTITGVPEPGTLALLAIGLLPGAALSLRRKYSAG